VPCCKGRWRKSNHNGFDVSIICKFARSPRCNLVHRKRHWIWVAANKWTDVTTAGCFAKGQDIMAWYGTFHPSTKVYLTFDVHLFHQFTNCWGLEDKSDETVEKSHQTLSYENRENCITRELGRRRSQEIRLNIDQHEEIKKQSKGTKRAIDATGSLQLSIRAKGEKGKGGEERGIQRSLDDFIPYFLTKPFSTICLCFLFSCSEFCGVKHDVDSGF